MQHDQQPPTRADVEAAAGRIAGYLPRTPLRSYPLLERLLDAQVWVKHENHLPTGAFKVRGGVNLAAQLPARSTLIAASTGNHGQSVAYGAQLFGHRAIVVVPRGANPLKVGSIRDLGAEIVEHGADYDDAREHCEALADEHGYRYVHSGDEPDLIAGVGTATLELLEEQAVEVIVVPIGGGSGAAGAAIASEGRVEVIGVQSAEAPAAWESWKAGEQRTAPMGTFAEGLATRTAFALPQRILRERLTDFLLVPDTAIAAAQRTLIEATRNLVEAAAAAPLAGALAIKDRLRGRRVALICSGGNATLDQLRALLS